MTTNSAARKLLRGSIYLAKITRVEPSLQAAFVDYGGNRHGFLAFSEIHPDYYQIPHADKLALLEEEERERAAYEEALDASEDFDDDVSSETSAAAPDDDHSGDQDHHSHSTDGDTPAGEAPDDYDFEANAIDVTSTMPDLDDQAPSKEAEAAASTDAATASRDEDQPATPAGAALAAFGGPEEVIRSEMIEAPETVSRADDGQNGEASPTATSDADAIELDEHAHIASTRDNDDHDDEHGDVDEDDDVIESLNDSDDEAEIIETLSVDEDDDDEDEDENAGRQKKRARPQRPRRRARQYKIQEVIKRRQIVLIQVVKEERGNKGAALTTYLSLAGRYTVLMPNTARGGGISRKITNVQDRKRLKAIAQELEVPEGMGLIIRTAGAARTKQEIKRDFEYLLRLWENVRSLTLESTAPSLVYEEGNLIKRSIRDLYTKEIEEIVVAGEEAHKEAKSFMRMLMPSHAKNVIKHEGTQSLFAKYRIEQQLNAMFSPNVQLKSGGYLVINQTEALVAIDVNSGKSTREFSIEETALNTNLEAAEELSRQLKLRDLAGLIVVDFIDMEEKRNNRAVERRLKDSLRADRARIQVGRISHFGLLEMSRQRLRTGVLEGSTTPCEHCLGSGIVRSVESVSLAVLRGIEDALVAGKMSSCVATCAADVALYLLNQKRLFIQELENRYGVTVYVRASDKQQGANFAIDPLIGVERPRPISRDAVNIDAGFTSERVAANDDESEEPVEAEAKPRRRRRRRGRRDDAPDRDAALADEGIEIELADNDDDQDGDEHVAAKSADGATGDESEDRPRRSRRRGRRGGRRHRDQRTGEELTAEASGAAPQAQDNQHIDAAQTAHAGDASKHDGDFEAPEPARYEHTSNGATAPDQDQATSDVSSSGSEAELAEKIGREDPQQAAPDQVTEEPAVAKPVDEPTEANTVAAAEVEPAPTIESSQTETVEQLEPAGESISEPVAAEEAKPAAVASDQVDRLARSQPVASEPVIQRVHVGPNGAGHQETAVDVSESDAAAEPKPAARRGWWQRQFGG